LVRNTRGTLHEAEALGIYLGWTDELCAGRLYRFLLQCGAFGGQHTPEWTGADDLRVPLQVPRPWDDR